jgi:hypothetical protein
LKNRRLLTLIQECQEHDLAIRKFQLIVVCRHLSLIDLPKNRRPVFYYLVVPRPQSDRQPANLISKGQLGSWSNADSNPAIFHRDRMLRADLVCAAPNQHSR